MYKIWVRIPYNNWPLLRVLIAVTFPHQLPIVNITTNDLHSYQEYNNKQINGRKFKSKEENTHTHTPFVWQSASTGLWHQAGSFTSLTPHARNSSELNAVTQEIFVQTNSYVLLRLDIFQILIWYQLVRANLFLCIKAIRKYSENKMVVNICLVTVLHMEKRNVSSGVSLPVGVFLRKTRSDNYVPILCKKPSTFSLKSEAGLKHTTIYHCQISMGSATFTTLWGQKLYQKNYHQSRSILISWTSHPL